MCVNLINTATTNNISDNPIYSELSNQIKKGNEITI